MVAGSCRRWSSRDDCHKCGKRTGENDQVQSGQGVSWFHLSCTSLLREVHPLLSVSENLSIKSDNCLKCDLKAATLEEVEEKLLSVVSDTNTQELSKIPQTSPSTVKAIASNIETQKPTCSKGRLLEFVYTGHLNKRAQTRRNLRKTSLQ